METESMSDWSFHETKSVNTETLIIQEVADYPDAAGQLGYGPVFTPAIHYRLQQRELIVLKWSNVHMKKPSLTIHAGRVAKEGKPIEYVEKFRELWLSPEAVDFCWHRNTPSIPAAKRYLSRNSEILLSEHGTAPAQSNIGKTEILHTCFEHPHHNCAVLTLQNGMTAAKLTHLQSRRLPTLIQKIYAEHKNRYRNR